MNKKLTTKKRLLQAAAEIFAAKGFRDATVAEICEAAGANIAAVNYHFGDKSKLYSEVWHYLFTCANEQFPIPKDHTDTGAEEWLRQVIQSRIKCIESKGPAGLFPQLIHREMNDLTPEVI